MSIKMTMEQRLLLASLGIFIHPFMLLYVHLNILSAPVGKLCLMPMLQCISKPIKPFNVKDDEGISL